MRVLLRRPPQLKSAAGNPEQPRKGSELKAVLCSSLGGEAGGDRMLVLEAPRRAHHPGDPGTHIQPLCPAHGEWRVSQGRSHLSMNDVV